MKYPIEIYNECKRIFVQENKSPRDTAKQSDEFPCWQTIRNWATKKDGEGKTWYDCREDYKNDQYTRVSPRQLANKILERISNALQTYKEGDSKSADELVKLSRLMERVVDKKLQIHTMFDMLTDYVRHLKKYYPDLMAGDTGKQILESIRDFKNNLRSRLEH